MVAANLWHLGWVHMVGVTPATSSWQWQPSPRVGLLPHKWQYPNNHPLCHLCGAIVLLLLQHKLASCNSSKLTILRASSTKFTWYLPHFSITRITKAHLFSHKRITSTRWSPTSHLKSVNVYLWDNIPLRAYQPYSVRNEFFKPHIKAYNTPSNGNFYFQVRQSLSEYLNMIMNSPLFEESTHPGVASALCSTLGTTPYFSVSLSLLVLRV